MSVDTQQSQRAQAARSHRSPCRRSRGLALLHLMIAIAAVGMMLSASVSIFGAEAPLRQAAPSPGHKRIAQRSAAPRAVDARAAGVIQPGTAAGETREAGRVGERQTQDAPMMLRASAVAEQTNR